MKPNIKGKIIIGVTLAFVGGTTIWLIVNRLRKRRIMNDIMGQLKDATSEEGQQAILQEENQIKGSNAFDTTFWKKTTGSPLPNANLLMRPMDAREMAKKFAICLCVHYTFRLYCLFSKNISITADKFSIFKYIII